MSGKVCPKCTRDDVEFGVRVRNGKTTQQGYCKNCNKTYHKGHYGANKQTYLSKNKARRDRFYEEFLQFMLGKVCADCGNPDRRVLEFDHLSEKEDEISRMLHNTVSWPKILEEMAKCDIVCCNCHRIRTLGRMQSKKTALSSSG